MPLSVGDRLGRYEIRGFLGAGGMGEVYRAHDGRLDRDVAIKILPEGLTHHPDRLAAVRARSTRGRSPEPPQYPRRPRSGRA